MSTKHLRLALVLLLAFAWVRAASAAEYETFIDVDDEDGLYSLFEQNQIGETTLNALLELMQTGVNLDTAGRSALYSLPNLTYADVDAILAYRAEAGGIADPAALVTAGVLSKRKVQALAAFLVVQNRLTPEFTTKGRFKLDTLYVGGETRVPGVSLRARVATLGHLEVGLAGVVTRNRIGAVTFDENRFALTADPMTTRLNLPKLYAKWETSDWGVIAGTYREGFAQRLTFDDTSDYTPYGFTRDDVLTRTSDLTRVCKESASNEASSPCTGDARYLYGSPDWKWREGLFGVSAQHTRLSLGPGWLEAYGFFSHQNRSVYQYQLANLSSCSDPNDPSSCDSPDVYVRNTDDPFAPETRHAYQTLPDAFAETVGGGNLTYALSSRAHVGVTAYGAGVSWLVPDLSLDFKKWARLPYGGPFGAVGVDVAGGYDWFDVFLEVTRSFDSMPDNGGGMGALLRSVASFGQHELEASLRYYDTYFYNPYARPIAASDLSDGLRARDETGLRLKYAGRMLDKRLGLRAMADVWLAPSLGVPSWQGYVRGNYELTPEWDVGLWLDRFDKQDSDLADCLSDPSVVDASGNSLCPLHTSTKATALAKWSPSKRLSITAAYQHELVDDKGVDTGLRQDASAWATVLWRVSDQLRLRLRTRWLDEAITDDTYLRQYLWTWAEAGWTITKGYTVRLRYDLVVWLDQRSSTLSRTPSPENWFWLGFEGRF